MTVEKRAFIKDPNESAYYLINGGLAKKKFDEFMENRDKLQAYNMAMANELGVRRVTFGFAGNVTSVQFPGDVHKDFTKPDKQGMSRPKKHTEWAARFDSYPKFPSPETLIGDIAGFPLELRAISADKNQMQSGVMMRNRWHQAGFMNMPIQGISAFHMPDVVACREEFIKKLKRDHSVEMFLTNENFKNFNGEIPGTTRIHKHEWEAIEYAEKVKEIIPSRLEVNGHVFELNSAYIQGAVAHRSNPEAVNNFSPDGEQWHDWNDGFSNEQKNLHIVDGVDVITNDSPPGTVYKVELEKKFIPGI